MIQRDYYKRLGERREERGERREERESETALRRHKISQY